MFAFMYEDCILHAMHFSIHNANSLAPYMCTQVSYVVTSLLLEHTLQSYSAAHLKLHWKYHNMYM